MIAYFMLLSLILMAACGGGKTSSGGGQPGTQTATYTHYYNLGFIGAADTHHPSHPDGPIVCAFRAMRYDFTSCDSRSLGNDPASSGQVISELTMSRYEGIGAQATVVTFRQNVLLHEDSTLVILA